VGSLRPECYGWAMSGTYEAEEEWADDDEPWPDDPDRDLDDLGEDLAIWRAKLDGLATEIRRLTLDA
jgi:hypothetical protein